MVHAARERFPAQSTRFHPEKPAGSAMKFRARWNLYDWFGRTSTPFILASRTPLNLYWLVIQVEMNGTVKKRFHAQGSAPAENRGRAGGVPLQKRGSLDNHGSWRVVDGVHLARRRRIK